ncbi:hypothetical protein [Nonomuraea wenchangensis]|uniref:Uncharacterized protein n=1 Tax=Nonomuraea wenchangensis TaxID=568860 RepID=A0A1I0L880_9ACTN|nr:hypothetical protein [Nonomuraea wenchangensis]SEU36139.1 hypothetical protein SAMN05421811_113139 [Nonomuraea wenchangensis]
MPLHLVNICETMSPTLMNGNCRLPSIIPIDGDKLSLRNIQA